MELEQLIYQERKNTCSVKWDAMRENFGEDDLEAFWVADMDFRSPACVHQAVRDWAGSAIYGYHLSRPAWKQAFIDWEARVHETCVEGAWLRYAPGIVTALYWAVSAFSSPGEAVAVLKPVYYPFFSAIADTGRKLVSCDLVNTNGVYTIDFAALEELFRQEKPRLLILSSPHNPVGRVFRREELERICELCGRYDVLLLSDEIHQDLVYGDREQISALRIRQKGVVAFASASKTFNIAGLRNSYVILPDPDLRARFDDYIRRAVNVSSGTEVSEVATIAAFEGGEPWLRSLLRQVRENFETVRDILKEKAPKAVVSELEGTYLMWIDLQAYVRTDGEVKDLVQKQCRLAVDYGDWFGGEDYIGFIRINLATRKEDCARLANRLGDALAAL